MQIGPSTIRNALGLLSISGLLLVVPLGSAWAADASNDMAKERLQHRQEWVRAKLERDANRLEIKASQQAAWQEYASARKAFAERTLHRPPQDADAAMIAKNHAERAAEVARKLATLADATAKLQVVLSPEQRMTLDQMARHGHHKHGHHGWRDDRDGLRGEGHRHASDPEQEAQAPAA